MWLSKGNVELSASKFHCSTFVPFIVSIYSETLQTFDIIQDEGETLSDKGDPTLNYYCVDENGTKCRIRIVKRNDSTTQIYADYNNLILCYNVKRIN